HKKFILYYLLCGVIATLTQVWISGDSVVPIVGASGAISGIMAGYMLKYPSAKVHTLIFIFPVILPAVVVVGFWFATQIINGIGDLYSTGDGGVAWFSHIGGFVAGGLLMLVISRGKFYWLKR
ncbi:MAG: rhomboid family intramembrane serine protease, partial [Candidatus Marinimicrobia bacterium]|nr:rhomboid family intramembrane serine protease [Candidatus Neomarinimicrobiota bacterium]